MNTGKAELYGKCEKKLEMISSKRDCDLRILVGHSTMLQSLMPYVFPETESSQVSIQDCRAESDIIACSEHEEFSPLLYEISVTERELPQEGAKIQQAERNIIESPHVVVNPLIASFARGNLPFFE
jgi:hypothetical protein